MRRVQGYSQSIARKLCADNIALGESPTGSHLQSQCLRFFLECILWISLKLCLKAVHLKVNAAAPVQNIPPFSASSPTGSAKRSRRLADVTVFVIVPLANPNVIGGVAKVLAAERLGYHNRCHHAARKAWLGGFQEMRFCPGPGLVATLRL